MEGQHQLPVSERMREALAVFRDPLHKDRRCLPGETFDDGDIRRYGFSQRTFKALQRRRLVERIDINPIMRGYMITEAGRALLPPKEVAK